MAYTTEQIEEIKNKILNALEIDLSLGLTCRPQVLSRDPFDGETGAAISLI